MYQIDRARRWLRKGQQSSDSYDRYISYFIALNILYNLNSRLDLALSVDDNDRDQLLNITQIIVDKRMLIERLGNLFQNYLLVIPVEHDERWERNGPLEIACKLKEAYANSDYEAITNFLFKWLYKVRCNIVHGDKEYNPSHWGVMLVQSNTILEKIIKMLIGDLKVKFGEDIWRY